MREKRRPGKPVTHPRVVCLDDGRSWKTYTEAANAVGGSRYGVRKCCNGVLKTHKRLHFAHEKEE